MLCSSFLHPVFYHILDCIRRPHLVINLCYLGLYTLIMFFRTCPCTKQHVTASASRTLPPHCAIVIIFCHLHSKPEAAWPVLFSTAPPLDCLLQAAITKLFKPLLERQSHSYNDSATSSSAGKTDGYRRNREKKVSCQKC